MYDFLEVEQLPIFESFLGLLKLSIRLFCIIIVILLVIGIGQTRTSSMTVLVACEVIMLCCAPIWLIIDVLLVGARMILHRHGPRVVS